MEKSLEMLSFWQQIYPVNDKTFITNNVPQAKLSKTIVCLSRQELVFGRLSFVGNDRFIHFGIDLTSCVS